MPIKWIFTALLLSVCIPLHAGVVASEFADKSLPNAYSLGIAIQTILPNSLPQLENMPPIYGPVFSIPLGEKYSLQLKAQYGGLQSLSLYLIEPAFRINVSTPFFSAYALAGGEFLHYSFAGSKYEFLGWHLGTGFILPMGEKYRWQLGMKSYVLKRTLICFEGSFSFLL